MYILNELEPKRVFYYFEEISRIPHGSRNTKAISDYLVAFAKEHNLKWIQDDSNNVLIFKNGTTGYEQSEPIIIQGHMDMVCECEKDCTIDFEKEGLSLYVEGDFVKAKGTTLGGDDGIAIAYALAILESDEIPHPPLEVIITVDEEIGMFGAFALDLSMVKAKKMLNIDSDVEGHFLTSCAGGITVGGEIPISRIVQKGLLLNLSVTGLLGGHSGAEIDKERGNANVLMGRVLKQLTKVTPFGIVSLAGGLKDNAIPRTCNATLLLPLESKAFAEEEIMSLNNILLKEFLLTDKDVTVEFSFGDVTECNMLDFASVQKVIYFLRTVPNGVLHMSSIMQGLVETSLNLGIIELKEDMFITKNSIRSSVSSRKEEVTERVCNIIEFLGGEASTDGDYPAWEYKTDSVVRKQMGEVYRELFDEEPVFEAIHAGLECGIFSEKIKDLDCVSFGPNNYDIHTPQERLSIASTERIWKLILEFLKRSK